MAIDLTLRKEIVNFLMKLPSFQSEGGRRAILLSAGLDAIIPSIDLSGNTTEFVSLLIEHLDQYGTLPGQQSALIRLLQAVATQVGIDKQAILRTFCERLTTPAEKFRETCPYRGLFIFREQDAAFFFGRDVFTAQLLEAVQEKSLVAVIGSSGSGKSSVVFAGLLPHLRQFPSQERQGWVIAHFRPGNEPFRALAAALIPLLELKMSETDRLVEIRKLAKRVHQGELRLHEVTERILQKSRYADRLLLFVDQFEELYTLCAEAETRRQFLDELLGVIGVQTLVCCLTLRADFMEQALTYRPFADALQDTTLNLGPMTREELQSAIEYPAKKLNIAFEPGLIERILDEFLAEHIPDEGKRELRSLTGSLPLLEFALTLLWERQVSGKLTHEAYETIGQVKGALARHADEVYNSLHESEQKRLRKVLVQMVRPGEGTEDTRRLASHKELDEEQWALVQRMADTRLVVTNRDPAGEETVEVVHESLILGWGRLRQWMSEDRRFRTWQERLRAALHQWETSQYDKGALLRGVPLAEAEDWLAERETDLGQAEQRFIETSLELRRQEEAEKEEQHRRQLEAAQKLAEEANARQAAEEQARKEADRRAEEQTEAATRLRRRALALAVVVVLAIGAAVFGWIQQQKTQENEKLAIIQAEEAAKARDAADKHRKKAEKQAEVAKQERNIARSRQLAIQANKPYLGNRLWARITLFFKITYSGSMIFSITRSLS